MEIPTYNLLILGCLGAADILLFHSLAHGIRSHPDSIGELVTHSLRGPTYAALFLFIPNFEMHGAFAWALLALFVFDVGISIWDFALEQGSRRSLGGLPSGEYVLHMIMAGAFGSLVATILCFGQDWFTAPTRLLYAPAGVPSILRLILAIMAIAVLASGIQDAAAALRLGKVSPERSSGPSAQSAPLHQHRNLPEESVPLTRADAPVRQTPSWMRLVLVLAGVYNLLWGARVVIFPEAFFRWIGAPIPNYPQIWHCVGMIVGVYGVGYLFAAADPIRHWAIIFVGLLGKVLGPLGMWWSVSHGSLPASMAWTCLTNDLIWWMPFAAILFQAFRGQRHFYFAGVRR